MEYKCTIRFESHGELIRRTGVPANELWLDVGNSLVMGCIDHHHTGDYESTLGALAEHPELLDSVRRCAENGQPIVVHLHVFPDLDCFSSFYAFRYYMEHGEEEFLAFFGPDGGGHGLVEYINDIDRGRKKVTSAPTLYAVSCAIQEAEDRTEQKHLQALEKGLELIACALEAQRKTGESLETLDLTDHLPDSFSPEIRKISSFSFEDEKASGRVRFETISLWKKTEKGMAVEDVRAAVWKTVPSFASAYDYARKEGALLTVVPYMIRENGDKMTRVFASVDPEKDRDHAYTLRPLAEIIEQMEQVEEEHLYEQAGSYRRDHSEPRKNEGLLGTMPFAATSNPWYVSAEEDLFDAPHGGSLLEYRDILKVIRKNASAVKKAYTVEIDGDTVRSRYESTQIPLSVWQEDNRSILSRKEGYVVIWAEVDASLIQQNNRMLEAYCMNLTGKPFFEKKDGNLYFADYRTCIYSDLDCTIVLVATYDERNLKQLPVAELAGLPADGKAESESFRTSQLVEDVSLLLKQRGMWLGFGTRIGSMKPSDHKGLEKLNSEILVFSAEAQKEDMISSAFERELYQFIKKQFGNEELKGSVMEEMQLIIDESRNKLVSGFNWLSSIAVPFLILSALFEMGLFRIDSVLEFSGPVKWLGWAVLLGICGGVARWLYNRNNR